MPTETHAHSEHQHHQHYRHRHESHENRESHESREHEQADQDRQELRRVLDFDAEVFGANLGAVLDRTGVLTARRVVDLGAGTGAGSRLLRQRFPEAAVLGVDNDSSMLDLLRAQGFAAVEADLDQGFPADAGSAEAGVDLIWAASSLHHVAHPDRLLSGARRALAPTGVLAVVELAGLPRFLARPAEAALEQRCHAAAESEGWNDYPDWTPVIENAGFVVTASTVRTAVPVTPAAREYAVLWLSRFSRLASLTPADRGALEELLSRSTDDLELAPAVTRTVWVCSPTRG